MGYSVDPDLRNSWSVFLAAPFGLFVFGMLSSLFGVYFYSVSIVIITIWYGYHFKNVMNIKKKKYFLLGISASLNLPVFYFSISLAEFYESSGLLVAIFLDLLYIAISYFAISKSLDMKNFYVIYSPFDMKDFTHTDSVDFRKKKQ